MKQEKKSVEQAKGFIAHMKEMENEKKFRQISQLQKEHASVILENTKLKKDIKGFQKQLIKLNSEKASYIAEVDFKEQEIERLNKYIKEEDKQRQEDSKELLRLGEENEELKMELNKYLKLCAGLETKNSRR